MPKIYIPSNSESHVCSLPPFIIYDISIGQFTLPSFTASRKSECPNTKMLVASCSSNRSNWQVIHLHLHKDLIPLMYAHPIFVGVDIHVCLLMVLEKIHEMDAFTLKTGGTERSF